MFALALFIAQAQDTVGPQPVKFLGQHLHYDARAKVVYLTDSSWVQTGDVTLTADTVILWQEPQIVHSHGNFTLITGKNTTRGDSLKYSIRTDRGMAYTSRAFVDKGWVRGRKIYKMSKTELCLQAGDFTTCENEKPHYSFVAYRMRVLRDDIAVVWPLIFKIGDIPVAAAPFWFFPIKRERSSGFLAPKVGYHSQDGKYYRNVAYYWAINNYLDLTLGTDLLEKRGPRVFTNLVYNRYKSFGGNMLFTYANDIKDSTYRWSIDGVHSQTLLGFDIGAQASFLSDVDYRQDYSEDKTEFLRSESYSYISIYRAAGPVAFAGTADRRDDLIRGAMFSNIPALDVALNTQTIGPISLGGSSRFRRASWRDTTGMPTQDAQAADASLSMSLPQFSLLRYLRFTPGASGRAVWFALDTLGNPNPYQLSSRYYISASTSIYGLGQFKLWRFTRFLHTLTPTATLTYAPKPRELRVEPVGEIGPSSEAFFLSYEVSNTFEGKMQKDTSFTKIQLANLSLSQSYDILADSLPFSDVRISLEALPGGRIGAMGLSSRASASYGVYDGRLKEMSITNALSFRLAAPADTSSKDTMGTDTTGADTALTEEKVIEANKPRIEPWSFSLGHTFSPSDDPSAPDIHTLDLTAKGNLSRGWFASYEIKYNITGGKALDQSLALTRDLHCWRMDFSWNTFGNAWVYNLSFVIKNLPDIELKRGFFDLFLPR
ncbi:MAG: putative LPS assembly protein LptD [candidate division WOR-3 bacterium]